jgi:hypothetical protein
MRNFAPFLLLDSGLLLIFLRFRLIFHKVNPPDLWQFSDETVMKLVMCFQVVFTSLHWWLYNELI